jgi:hypothetical protein
MDGNLRCTRPSCVALCRVALCMVHGGFKNERSMHNMITDCMHGRRPAS